LKVAFEARNRSPGCSRLFLETALWSCDLLDAEA
jgi:hypothetical protein